MIMLPPAWIPLFSLTLRPWQKRKKSLRYLELHPVTSFCSSSACRHLSYILQLHELSLGQQRNRTSSNGICTSSEICKAYFQSVRVHHSKPWPCTESSYDSQGLGTNCPGRLPNLHEFLSWSILSIIEVPTITFILEKWKDNFYCEQNGSYRIYGLAAANIFFWTGISSPSRTRTASWKHWSCQKDRRARSSFLECCGSATTEPATARSDPASDVVWGL